MIISVQVLTDAMKVAAETHEASLFEYEGVHFQDSTVKKETLDDLPKWPARKDDVFVVTYPKAGLCNILYDFFGWGVCGVWLWVCGCRRGCVWDGGCVCVCYTFVKTVPHQKLINVSWVRHLMDSIYLCLQQSAFIYL